MTILNKKDYAKFKKLIEGGLKHPVDLVPNQKLMDHDEFMKRLNGTSNQEATVFPQKIERPGREWRDFDRRHGNRRFEAIFSVTKAVRFVKKLFGKGEK